jgi:hypothetical protein
VSQLLPQGLSSELARARDRRAHADRLSLDRRADQRIGRRVGAGRRIRLAGGPGERAVAHGALEETGAQQGHRESAAKDVADG